MGNVIGLTPVPDDKPLEEFINELIEKDVELLAEKLDELLGSIEETEEEKQPKVFAYAKLMNYLAKGVTHPDLIHICCAALWEIIKELESDGA